MTREEAHKLVDTLYDMQSPIITDVTADGTGNLKEERTLPEGKRVVRTKTTGDRVYLLDDEKNTRHWVTNPTVLQKLGFELSDVGEATDAELIKYKTESAIYRVE